MDETVLADSNIAHEVLEQTADYLIRRQRFAGPPDEALASGWILAMTRWAQVMTDARLAVDVYSAEPRLRSIEPPFDSRARRSSEKGYSLPGSASRNCFFSPSPTATALD